MGLPAFLLAGTGKPQYFWPGWNQTLPMPGLNGRTSDWTTGMILGGGSSINGLYYGRGSNTMYSQWEGISGSSNWSLDNILATFQALETSLDISLPTSSSYIKRAFLYPLSPNKEEQHRHFGQEAMSNKKKRHETMMRAFEYLICPPGYKLPRTESTSWPIRSVI